MNLSGYIPRVYLEVQHFYFGGIKWEPMVGLPHLHPPRGRDSTLTAYGVARFALGEKYGGKYVARAMGNGGGRHASSDIAPQRPPSAL